MSSETDYDFTSDWFDANKETWSKFLLNLKPTRVLEVGSYEGRSTAYIIENLANTSDIEVHCIDTWGGSVEHRQGGSHESDMAKVESRFAHNMKVAIDKSVHNVELKIHRGFSSVELPKLLAQGMQGYFDFIYVDGSHQAPDVLLDAVLGFELLRVGGLMVFDDYLWKESPTEAVDPISCPKISIDAFTNIYSRKLEIRKAFLYQLYVEKTGV